MNKYILTLMDQNQSHQQNCENSHMFHLKKNLIILWQLIGYFFLFCVLQKCLTLYPLSHSHLTFAWLSFAFICPICVICFFKGFYWWMNLESVQWLIVISIDRLPPKLHDRHEVPCVFPFNIRIILCIYSYTTSSIIFWVLKVYFGSFLLFES